MIGVLGFDSRWEPRIFLLTTASRTALGPTQPPIQWVPGDLSLGVKRLGSEANHSPPSSAEVKEWVELYFHSLNTHSWRGAQLKPRDVFTFTFMFWDMILLPPSADSLIIRLTCSGFLNIFIFYINSSCHVRNQEPFKRKKFMQVSCANPKYRSINKHNSNSNPRLNKSKSHSSGEHCRFRFERSRLRISARGRGVLSNIYYSSDPQGKFWDIISK
jgi:hypothetical protein